MPSSHELPQIRSAASFRIRAGVAHGDTDSGPADHLDVIAAVAKGDAAGAVESEYICQTGQSCHLVDSRRKHVAFGYIVEKFYAVIIDMGGQRLFDLMSSPDREADGQLLIMVIHGRQSLKAS